VPLMSIHRSNHINAKRDIVDGARQSESVFEDTKRKAVNGHGAEFPMKTN
jgi:hypothetical protein